MDSRRSGQGRQNLGDELNVLLAQSRVQGKEHGAQKQFVGPGEFPEHRRAVIGRDRGGARGVP